MDYEETKKMAKDNIVRAISGSSGLIEIINNRITNKAVVGRIPIKELLSYSERLSTLAQKNLKIAGLLEGVDFDDVDENGAPKVEINEELRNRIKALLEK